jgi:hypothetical protein
VSKVNSDAHRRAAGGRYHVAWWGARIGEGWAAFHSEREGAQHLANIRDMLDARHTLNTQWHASLTDTAAKIDEA